MLGSPILYLKAMRILMFQLSGFYCISVCMCECARACLLDLPPVQHSWTCTAPAWGMYLKLPPLRSGTGSCYTPFMLLLDKYNTICRRGMLYLRHIGTIREYHY